jgi:FkbM family methyltransferase
MAGVSLNQLRYGRFNSALLRKCLSCCFREGVAYRVRFGPIRGMKLYYDRSVNFHAILGLWDAEEYAFLSRVLTRGRFLQPRTVVADVGANLGIFSLWSTRLLQGRDHRVFAFEPAPDTLRRLRENVAINGLGSIDVVPAACADREGTTEFFVGFHHHVSSLLKEWAHSEASAHATSVTVPTTTLDAFFAKEQESPDFIKMDIEGGGVFALRGCDRILSTKRPLLWVESHTPDEDRAISGTLAAHDYCAYRFTDRRPVTHPDTTHPDPDGVWGTLLLYPREQHRRIEEAL